MSDEYPVAPSGHSGRSKFNVQCFTQICHLSSLLGFPEQTLARRGSSVFCVSKSSEVERERMEPPERMSVFAMDIPTWMLI